MTDEVTETKARLVGEVVVRDLKKVRANPWNPNHMTPEQMESLKHGFLADGWLVSQALLVWGTDEKGAKQDIIIDGEHRWIGAKAVGLTKGPMVFLNGITEAEAKKLTIKLNQKRGAWDPTKLEDLLRGLEQSGEALEAMDLGFGEEELLKLLAMPVADTPDLGGESPDGVPPPVAPGETDAPRPNVATGGEAAAGQQVAQTRMVQLYLDSTTQPKFLADCQSLAADWGLKGVSGGTATITDVVLEVVSRARAASQPST